MMKWMLAASAAALAITAPSAAERGGGRGGGEQPAKAQKADRGGKGQQARTERSGGGKQRPAQAQRGGEQREARALQRPEQAESRGGGRGDAMRFRTIEQPGKVRQAEARGPGRDMMRGRGEVRRVEARGPDRDVMSGRDVDRVIVDRDVVRVRDVDRRGVVRVRDIDPDDVFVRRLGYGAGGCPPGLAKKPVACMPPGQAKKLVGTPLARAARLTALDPLPRSMRSLYWDDDDYYYRWGGGYLYRVDRDDALIASMIPLFGAALLGQSLQPTYLNNYYRPSYFNAFYPNSPYDCYRYGYGYVYETDCMTGMVEDVIPTYDYGYGVGQLLPASYGYYNVPFAYRSYFPNSGDYYYRYAPGAIYQVDPTTQLITAVAALLTNGLTVGQPLPMGYSAHNVPLAYRSTYYDRPDIWYRYDNGMIYAVDPGTRMVNSVAYVIV